MKYKVGLFLYFYATKYFVEICNNKKYLRENKQFVLGRLEYYTPSGSFFFNIKNDMNFNVRIKEYKILYYEGQD